MYPDKDLPCPDVTFFMDLDPSLAAKRGNYGEERYEKEEFQHKVYKKYLEIKDASWVMLDATKTKEELEEKVLELALEKIEKAKSSTLGQLWHDLN